jgi:hypothetical protein
VGTKSCTAQASVSKVLQAVKLGSASPIRRSYLDLNKPNESHDQSVYAGKRWDTRRGREQWLLPSENSRFGVARRQGLVSLRHSDSRCTCSSPHVPRSSSNQSLVVLDACFVGNALGRALPDANRPLTQRHPVPTTAVILGLRYAHRSDSAW